MTKLLVSKCPYLNVVFTTKASKLGGKPNEQSNAVILMLLGLCPESFGIFLILFIVLIDIESYKFTKVYRIIYFQKQTLKKNPETFGT